MPGKRLPYMQFFTTDWLGDPKLSLSSLEAQGGWMRILCHLWEAEPQGTLTLTLAGWGRVLGLGWEDAHGIIMELFSMGVCEINEDPERDKNVTCHAVFTVMSRRLLREGHKRTLARQRQRDRRERQKEKGDVTPTVTDISNSNSNSNSRNQKKTSSSGQSRPSAPLPCPPELQDLELYRDDEKLKKRWAELLPAWVTAHPGIDVMAEIRKAHSWEVSNPTKRKKDRARFLGGWLGRAQDRGSSWGGGFSNTGRRPGTSSAENLQRRFGDVGTQINLDEE